jgi:TatD DNase family protein
MLDRPEASVAQARAVGVEQIVTIGIDGSTSRCAVDLAARLRGVFATVGLHPHDADAFDDGLLGELERLARSPRVVAVGECGLDFYRDLSDRDAQRHAFSAQIEMARRLSLPLVVHVRDAGEEAMSVLAAEAGGLTVVMHCFSLPQYVDECSRRGYYMSFAGNVTYRNADDLRAAAARADEHLLMAETDAPFLSPVPRRGRPNQPAWVAHTVEVIAGVRGWTTERAAEITTANARRAFRLPEDD